MRSMVSVYSAQDIAGACNGPARQVAIEIVTETGSTNADLMARLQDLKGATLLIAEKQTAGRGRAGRAWHMEPGKTLTFSLAWKFALPLSRLPGLSLAAGVVLAESLNYWQVDARLKWPNDVLKDGAKLAGILVEAAADKRTARHGAWAVIGIGLNLDFSAALSAQVDAPIAAATCLLHDPNQAVAVILSRLASALVQFEREGLQAFAGRWNRLHAYAGQPVAILEGDEVMHQGRAIGIDEAGRFVLENEQGRVAVMSGDVSLRLMEHR